MVVKIFNTFLLLCRLNAFLLVHYKFSSNFDQVIYDYSGLGNHGQNGKSIDSDHGDAKQNDRGAYFNEENYIMLPPNDLNSKSLVLGPSFSMVMWVYPLESKNDGFLVKRISQYGLGGLEIIQHASSNSLSADIKSEFLELERKHIFGTFSPSNKYIGYWTCIFLTNFEDWTKVRIDNFEAIAIRRTGFYTEHGKLQQYIGYNINSFKGFVWNYQLYGGIVKIQDFYHFNHHRITCLFTVCPSSCILENKNFDQYHSHYSEIIKNCQECADENKQNYCADCISNHLKDNSNEILIICSKLSPFSIPCSCGVSFYYPPKNFLKFTNLRDFTRTLKQQKEPKEKIGSCELGYYDDAAKGVHCYPCNDDCSACLTDKTCSICQALNSSPHPVIGCYCNPGFYNITALDSLNSCLICHSNCKTCSDSLQCETCKDDNSLPHSVVGCSCKEKYYNDTELNFNGACLPCLTECATCSDGISCITCIDANYILLNGRCFCNQGFYNLTALTVANLCLSCMIECQSCSNGIGCTSCIDPNSILLGTGRCSCKEGFYNTSAIQSTNSCLSCMIECKTCSVESACMTCIDPNAGLTISNRCFCKEGYYNVSAIQNNHSCFSCMSECKTCLNEISCSSCIDLNSYLVESGRCTCKMGFYNVTFIQNSLSCLPCLVECEKCSDGSKCLTCIDSNSHLLTTGRCLCNEGFYNNSVIQNQISCLLCMSECKACYNSNSCISCIDPNSILLGTGRCSCNEGFYNTSAIQNKNSCLSCMIECKTCSVESACMSCIDPNSDLTISNRCFCKEGYYNISAIQNNQSCFSCMSECKTCLDGISCSSCIDLNSNLLVSGRCLCNEGFFNTSEINNNQSCLPCLKECKNCSNEFSCLSCIDPNSYLLDTQRCYCKQGFYNESIINNRESCLPCFNECKNCSNDYTCNFCIDINSEPQLTGGCLCKERYFNDSKLTFQGSCLKCHSECKTCDDPLICISCNDPYSLPSSEKGCDCLDGFYKNTTCEPCHIDCSFCEDSSTCSNCSDPFALPQSPFCKCFSGFYNSSSNSSLSCSKCPENCTECENFTMCTVCLFKQMSNFKGNCECPENSELQNDTCVAKQGFFIDYDPVLSFYARICDRHCLNCSGEGSDNCESCASNIIKINGKCDSCNYGMYLYDYSCHNCTEDCESCLNSKFCLKCRRRSYFPILGICTLKCPDFTYLFNDTCLNCPSLCKKCNPVCIECVENSTLNSLNYCECPEGFQPSENICIEKYFRADFTINSDFLLKLSFSEEIKTFITESDFEFFIEKITDFKTQLLKNKSNKEFLFSIKFDESVGEDTIIQLRILKEKIYSVSGSMLENYSFHSILPLFTLINQNPAVEALMKSAGSISKSAVSTSIGASIISNPSAAWALLNSIQILTFLPISSNKLTPTIQAFLKGFSDYNILPNFLSSLFDSDASSSAYLEARRYGIKSSVFFINTGKIFFIFVATLSAWPILYALTKVLPMGKFLQKILKILGNYHYGFFLRFWTQSYLEIFVFSLIQMRSVWNK